MILSTLNLAEDSATVLQDVVITVLFGMIFGLVASTPYRRDRIKTLRYLVGFYAAGWLPLAVYLLLFHFGWSWWYYMPETTEHRPLLTVVPLFIEFFLTVGGYALTVWLIDEGKKSLALGAVALTGGMVLALLAVPFNRYGKVGDWSMYHANMATPLLETYGFLAELAIGFTWLGAVLALTLWKTWKLEEAAENRAGLATGNK